MALSKLPRIKYKTTEDYRKKFTKDNTERDKKFQRRSCWEFLQRQWYRFSMRRMYNIHPIIFWDVKASMEQMLIDKKLQDYQYFKEAYDRGIRYKIVEGANRNDLLQDHISDVEWDIYKDVENPYCIASGDRKSMHELYEQLAGGKAPNRQEKRTGIWGKVSDWVRNISENNQEWLSRTSTIVLDRMKDDEFIALILHYCYHDTFGQVQSVSSDDMIDDMYREKKIRPKAKKKAEDIVKKIKQYWKKLSETQKTKMPKAYVMGLIILLSKTFDLGFILKKGTKFVIKYNTWWTTNMASTDIYHLDNSTQEPQTFNGLVKGIKGSVKMAKFKELVEDLVKEMVLDDIFTKDVSEDLATPEQRTKLIKEAREGDKVRVRQNGVVDGNKIFGDKLDNFIWVDYLEVLSSNDYHVDHIIPKTKDGKTTLDNMEITTRHYNILKSNKMPNYTKIIQNS